IDPRCVLGMNGQARKFAAPEDRELNGAALAAEDGYTEGVKPRRLKALSLPNLDVGQKSEHGLSFVWMFPKMSIHKLRQRDCSPDLEVLYDWQCSAETRQNIIRP